MTIWPISNILYLQVWLHAQSASNAQAANCRSEESWLCGLSGGPAEAALRGRGENGGPKQGDHRKECGQCRRLNLGFSCAGVRANALNTIENRVTSGEAVAILR
jgi:hypothetical protein